MNDSRQDEHMNEEALMRRAICLAQRGIGAVNPNPLVGAVIARNGVIIGEGWHERYGGLHAERNALAHCTEDPAGADMFVTLEPCCHQGKQPPCTDAVIAAGIARIFVGSDDPNPLVAGKGLSRLEAAGITVVRGFLKEECDRLNPVFFHYITHKTPYVIQKIAMTADGKTATRTGQSRWITGEAARRHTHETRKRCAAIMVGIGTVLADDPALTCRLPEPRDPVRIVCDSRLRIPLDCQLVETAAEIPTYVAACRVEETKAAQLREKGVHILPMPQAEGHVDLRALMRKLGEMGLDSVLLEGGAALHEAALRAGIVQHLQIYIAPKIFGGDAARSAVGGLGVAEVAQAYRLTDLACSRIGEDILLEYEVEV